jgi:hypothetical protein
MEPGQSMEPMPQPTGCIPRVRKVPRALQDFLPHSLSKLSQPLQALAVVPQQPAPAIPESVVPDLPITSSSNPINAPSQIYTTSSANDFGLFHSYLTVPLRDLEAELGLDNITDAPTFAVAHSENQQPWWGVFGCTSLQQSAQKFSAPFLNATVFHLMSWFYSGSSMKLLGELDRLVNDVLLAKDFSTEDLHGFSAVRESQCIDNWEDLPVSEGLFPTNDGWQELSVHIQVLGEEASQAQPENLALEFEISQIFHRSLTEIISTTFQSTKALTYNLISFKLYAQKPHADSHPATHTIDSSLEGNDIERVYSELYNSDAMLAEYEHIDQQTASLLPDLENHDHNVQPPITPAVLLATSIVSSAASDTLPQPHVENVIAAIMLYSDLTHLASFGNAALWSAYLFFGNLSKYVHGKPSKLAAHHIAYLPLVCHFVWRSSLTLICLATF